VRGREDAATAQVGRDNADPRVALFDLAAEGLVGRMPNRGTGRADTEPRDWSSGYRTEGLVGRIPNRGGRGRAVTLVGRHRVSYHCGSAGRRSHWVNIWRSSPLSRDDTPTRPGESGAAIFAASWEPYSITISLETPCGEQEGW
jgi:hypothetical protein